MHNEQLTPNPTYHTGFRDKHNSFLRRCDKLGYMEKPLCKYFYHVSGSWRCIVSHHIE